MKKAFFLLFVAVSCAKPVQTTVSIVPQPVSVVQYADSVTLGSFKTVIRPSMGAEEYVLNTASHTIKAGSEAGAFYAMQTVRQLEQQAKDGKIPSLVIKDAPEFEYRGAHLDCCRHFWTIPEVKQFIDIMALHKLNVFHWHLTEDQGWRIEIKKYPELTEVGAWRKGTKIGHLFDETKGIDNIPYGGYYTQDECREIVAYAAERHITVLPEIEMPGHALSILAAYPQLGCTGGPYEVSCTWGVFDDVLCVGKDETVQFLKDVLDEVCDIFPSHYIHIGGDESPRVRWEACPACQARMKAEGLENEAQLQSWLNHQIEQHLAAKGRAIIGWDEILEGGVSKEATVMSWRGPAGGKAAAAQGNDAVFSPYTNFYFDFYQTEDPEANHEPLSIGGNLTLEKVYSFDPYEDLNEEERAHVKGIQANMWTEYVSEWDGILFRELPRMSALAECAWASSRRVDYGAFVGKVETALLPIYEEEGWGYAPYAFK